MHPPSRPRTTGSTPPARVEPDTRDAGPRAGVHPTDRPRTPSALAVLGLVLLCSGLASLGWLGYQLVGTDLAAARDYERETHALRAGWADPAPARASAGESPGGPAAVPGTATGRGDAGQAATALLRIPRLGPDYEVPVLQGTGADVLARGVGHYAGTAEAGQIGNFAVAGHRITHGQPFSRLLALDPGDQIIVETREATYTYVLDTAPRDLTVTDAAGWVLDPVPGDPGAAPDTARITLTTCQDLFHSPDRSIGFGHLERTQPR